ncbi:unnamed protein product [Prorocentrum cordatum]|uniref:Chloride channel protein n=1 Tax=Prorocentrum cordatum TaxID=2364126 RepID=A0ABN9XRI4_9DINO|nr:unnamed protein product [Polarella glacialis]
MAQKRGQRKIHAGLRWVVLAAVGCCTGLVAVGVDTGVSLAFGARDQLVHGVAGGVRGPRRGPPSAGVASCLALASVAGVLVCFVEPQAAGSGIPEVKCHLNGIEIPHLLALRTLLVKAPGVMFSVAAGLPCGKEGPMIHSGACIASVLSRACAERLLQPYRPDIEARDLVAAGASCGVAAAFGAPLGGVLFAMEEGASFFDPDTMLRCFVCCAAATLTTHFFISGVNGWEAWGRMGADGGAPASFGRFDQSGYRIWELAVFALLGAAGGLLGAAFNSASSAIRRWRLRNVPPRGLPRLLEVLAITFVVSSVAFVVPAATSEGSAASRLYRAPGTDSLRSLSGEGEFDKGGLLVFGVLYYAMACWTYGAGVPSGLFVPSLLAGAAFGRLAGEALSGPFGLQSDVEGTSDAGVYALVGATALLAGNARITISLAAILIEASGSTLWAVPIFVTTMCAKWAGDVFNEGSITYRSTRTAGLCWKAAQTRTPSLCTRGTS